MAASTKLTASELSYALETIHICLKALGVQYGVIGGAACCHFRDQYGLPRRLTGHVDILIIPNSKKKQDAGSIGAALIKNYPKYFGAIDQYGVKIPAIRIARDSDEVLAEVEIFDYECWPYRPQYNLQDPDNDRVALRVGSADVNFLSPRWLARENILSSYQRAGSQKAVSDLDDAAQMLKLVPPKHLLIKEQIQMDALNHFKQIRPPAERQAIEAKVRLML